MNRFNSSVIFKLFLLVLSIDAVLFTILVGLVLSAVVDKVGLTPELITWVAIYVSFMVVFSVVMLALVVLTVSIRVKDARHYSEVRRQKQVRQLELKRRKQQL
jgi:hypothetical protein